MKKLFAIALVAVLAGCATAPRAETPVADAKPLDPEPVLPELVDPNPFANYSTGMASDKAHPTAYEWQRAQGAAIAEATQPEVLGKFLASDAAARTLLDAVKDDYSTEPIVMLQIAAVTQLVMRDGGLDARRELWTKALLEKVGETGNVYRTMFCLDQLRWCGYPRDAKALGEVATSWEMRADEAATRHVREFAAQVAQELAR